jgi:hypothetical protein
MCAVSFFVCVKVESVVFLFLYFLLMNQANAVSLCRAARVLLRVGALRLLPLCLLRRLGYFRVLLLLLLFRRPWTPLRAHVKRWFLFLPISPPLKVFVRLNCNTLFSPMPYVVS